MTPLLKAEVKPKVDDEVRARRKEAGLWLLSLRQNAGLSQRQLASATGVSNYAFVAQIEHGIGRVPAERFEVWALALGQDPREFTIKAMSFYDRPLFDLLFAANNVVPQSRLNLAKSD